MIKLCDVGVIEFVGRKVTNQNAGMSGGLSSNMTWDVPYGKVDRICNLALSKLGKLGFICCNNYWYNCCTRRKLWVVLKNLSTLQEKGLSFT